MAEPVTAVSAPFPAAFFGAFTTRFGGSSTAGFASLNVALHVGDEPGVVTANREVLARWFGVPAVCWAQQVHGARVGIVGPDTRNPDLVGRGMPGVDALVTALPGVALGVLVADCAPVLLADPIAGLVATVHAGRRGLAAGVLQNTVATMATLGSKPADIVATIGPAIGGCCYEVPADLRRQVGAAVPDCVATTRWGTPALDLPRGARAVLERAGVARVVRVGGCTYEGSRFYSYRRDQSTGRFAGVLVRRS